MNPTSLLLERRERGLTQRELGQRIGISGPLISQYERGHKPITPERAIEIMRAMSAGTGTASREKSGAA